MAVEKRDLSYPKEVRILRPSEFRKVYAEGIRVSGSYFAAFCRKDPGLEGRKIGLTLPRALGKSVLRNRMRRRVREAVRLNLWRLEPGWMIAINPRRTALDAPFERLAGEVEKLFTRCKT